jgi:hypothetical protein
LSGHKVSDSKYSYIHQYEQTKQKGEEDNAFPDKQGSRDLGQLNGFINNDTCDSEREQPKKLRRISANSFRGKEGRQKG